ncbi:hypothetical protein ACFS07_01355 [Undibacterium arcticum]
MVMTPLADSKAGGELKTVASERMLSPDFLASTTPSLLLMDRKPRSPSPASTLKVAK